MLRRYTRNFAIFSILLDMGLTCLALALAAMVRPSLPQLPWLIPVPMVDLPPGFYVGVPVVWGVVFLLTSVYDPSYVYKAVDEFQRITSATLLAGLVAAGLLYFGFRDVSRWLFLTFLLFDLVLLLGWRVLARLGFRLVRLPAAERKVLIVGAGEVGQRVGQMIADHAWMGLNLAGYLDDDPEKVGNGLPVLGGVADVRRLVLQLHVDDVVVALPQRAYGQVNHLVVTLHDLPVEVRVVPDYFSLALYRATAEDFGGLPMINLRDPALNSVQRLVKRLLDLIIAGLAMPVVAPASGLVALAIRLDSPGPVIYRHKRVGENGRIFDMYKFRTMVDGAEEMVDQVTRINSEGELEFKRPDDPRITRLGRFLRRTSLDEMPQLINVLKGEMSMVGPRPELPWVADRYEPWQRKRFAVPQGLTGWWQVNGRSDKPMHLHTEDDLYYIQHYSLWMDMFILLKTPWVVLRGKGAF
jgi:exopolysaccharide biosynthesis polyprenyl glycosylphosphotransferase